MNAKETINKIKLALGMEVQLEQVKLDNGTILEADAYEAGQAVFIVSDEDRVALPVGEYTMEGGMLLVVAEEGIIAEIKEAEEEAPEAEEAPAEEAPAEEVEASEEAKPKKVVESITKEMFFAEIEKLRAEIEALKPSVELAEVTPEVTPEEAPTVELSEVAEEVKHSPEAEVKNNKQLFSTKRAATTKDRVYAKLFN